MESDTNPTRQASQRAARAFSLAELLVVVGVIALLISIMMPPLQKAHRQAKQTQCKANLHDIGFALGNALTDHDFFPFWDDGGSPTRYTWIDLLIQTQFLGNRKVGYCPEDARPDPANMARAEFYGVLYPGRRTPGIDYSYGISVPLSAGGWAWDTRFLEPGDTRNRRFRGHTLHTSSRVLVADAEWSAVYNLSGDAVRTNIWNQPTQYDNTVAWRRHADITANALMQDMSVTEIRYRYQLAQPVNTSEYFVWYPGEPLRVGPDYRDDRYPDSNYWYPNDPPFRYDDVSHGSRWPFPNELNPHFYTRTGGWTRITHKW